MGQLLLAVLAGAADRMENERDEKEEDERGRQRVLLEPQHRAAVAHRPGNV
jgi:hypothetical protein